MTTLVRLFSEKAFEWWTEWLYWIEQRKKGFLRTGDHGWGINVYKRKSENVSAWEKGK